MNDYSKIINPLTNERLSIYSIKGKNLLKNYVKLYKNSQIGGVEPALNNNINHINLNFITNYNNNAPINLNLDRSSTVLETKNILSVHYQVPVANIQLVFAGAFLDDDLRYEDDGGIWDGEDIYVHIVN